MNIKDLQSNSYRVVSSGTGVPLNINNLPKDSYSTVPDTKPKTPLLTKEQGGIGTALKDVAVGAGKAFVRGGRDIANIAQQAGKKVLGAFGVNTEGMGINAIDNNTAAGAQVNEQLQPKSVGEKVGGTLETVAELGTGFASKEGAKAIQLGEKGVQAYKTAQDAKAGERAIQNITPKTKDLTPTEYEDLLGKQKISPKTSTSPAQYVLSDTEKANALKYKDLLQSNDPVKNSINVINRISNIDSKVGDFLRQNNNIYNTGELKNFIADKLKSVSDIMIPEERVDKLKTELIDGFTKSLPKNNMEELWKARKSFDQSIKKVFEGSPTLQNTVKREFRNAVQDFIAERTPDGAYKTAMGNMRELFNLKDTLATKASKEKSLTGIKLWLKNNPIKTKIIGGYAGYETAKKLGILP